MCRYVVCFNKSGYLGPEDTVLRCGLFLFYMLSEVLDVYTGTGGALACPYCIGLQRPVSMLSLSIPCFRSGIEGTLS